MADGKGGFVTATMPLWMAKYFGTSADFWLNMQMRWDVYFAQQAEAAELAVIEPLAVHD